MTATIIECAQGTDAWHRARMGIPTASMFDTVMASGRGGGESKTRRKYLLQLAGEILTGVPMESYSNQQMERGHIMEAEARELYAFVTDEPLTQVGFIRNGEKGCSPDSLVGDKGMLEIKSATPHILIPILLNGEFPPEHKAQTQGGLLVAEREWIDLGIYWPKLPLFKKRAVRDEPYIKEMSRAIDQFNSELAELVEKIRHYGTAPARQPAPFKIEKKENRNVVRETF